MQILTKNLDLVLKQLDLATTLEGDIAASLVYDAMENVVSAFDGFGRESCRIHAHMATESPKAANVSFQNLERARDRLGGLFHIDLGTAVHEEEWNFARRCFMKRHLLAHKMGIVDQQYLNESGDSDAIVGRKVHVQPDEVRHFVEVTRQLGQWIIDRLLNHSGAV